MSTTSSLEVAMRYAASASPMLLRLKLRSFMECGADISFLSAFPAESEVVYPPMTFIKPTGGVHEVMFDGTVFTVVDVEPHFPS